ncbi:tubulin-specific chaperone E [Halyomorpha halys]|uniref:tubulin-specific chaperone E n=1 Tax=Halyomorpha halys TaxID=286706 RepID=UPI0006D4CC5A|nr:tubulin-specific chaperone E-like [Halyomorpha halys]
MVGVMTKMEVAVGDRVQVGEDRGTVLYVGPVPPTKGTWLGIDWDDPLRGKHNGVYDGTRYFQARYETSGSLVRLEKVQSEQSIISAIQERYGGTGQIMDSKELEEIQRAINAPLFMMVGFDKVSEMQSSFDTLSVVGLREHRISNAGDPGQLEKMCSNIVELDLSKNLFKSWLNVYDITLQLPKLKFLDLSENRLTYKDCNPTDLKDGFSNLEFLVLSKVEYSWEDILNCAVMWPNIERFQISFNKITSLSIPPSGILQNLKILNIEGNNISHWSEIEKLGTLPRLEILNASNTGITHISLATPNTLFASLKYILISGNFINNWESISELDKLPQLEELRLRNNPVLDGISRETVRQIIIARIAKLKHLNSQEVSDEERRGAEIDYLKHNGRMWLETAIDPKGRRVFNTLHPRYRALVQKYGEMEESELTNEKVALKANLVRIRIESKDKAVIEKQVPVEMSIRAFVFLAQRLFHIASAKLLLTLISSKNPLLKIELDNMMKTLSYYCVEDGDTVKVDW